MGYCRLLLLTAVLACWATGKGASTGIPHPFLDSFLSDQDEVESQIDCVLGRARCDETGRKLMVAIPEVLVRQCRLCSPDQAANARIVMDFIRYNYPLEWQEIVAKYGRRSR